MSQEAVASAHRPRRSFEERADATLRISVGIALAIVAAFGVAQWATTASADTTVEKPAVSVQASSDNSEAVHRCADGRVSFTPCR